ncbi:hypothetical protein ONZ45_g3320 [Pleurotus djamor]|nr:hypothetical protein ONZ45_g3320 [Pleurotus djamor]
MSTRDTFNGLTPPIGTSFFSMTDIPLMNDQDFPAFSSDLRVTWNVTMYKYAINALPTSENFREENGAIYIVMVHRGSFGRAPAWTSLSASVRLDPNEDTVFLEEISPADHTGRPQDDGSRSYSINFTHQMPMFRNQGTDAFVFDARYQNDFVLRVTQNGLTFAREHVWGFAKQADEDVGLTAINGLTVFRCVDPNKEVRFTFGHVGAEGVRQISEFYHPVTVNVGEFQ